MKVKDKKIYCSVYMEKSIWEKLDKLRKIQERSRNQLCVFAIKSYIEKLGG